MRIINNEEILKLLEQNLDIPCNIGLFQNGINRTHLTFRILSETPIWFADNIACGSLKKYKFDLWAIEENPYPYVEKLKYLLNSENFEFRGLKEVSSSNTRLFHLEIEFTYLMEVL